MADVNNSGEIRRHFASTPHLPSLTMRANTTLAAMPDATPARALSLSHTRTRSHQVSMVEHSIFSKLLTPYTDLTSPPNASRRLSSFQVFVPTENPRNDHFVTFDPVSTSPPRDMQDSRVSSGEIMLTKRSVPSCSALPNIWNPEMDRYIVRLVVLDKVKPHHLAKVMKNHFPELVYVSTLLVSPFTALTYHWRTMVETSLIIYLACDHRECYHQSCSVARRSK